ncbi:MULTISPECIES: hypothetical protein [Citrobacter]|uniref:hypothetical protein n=1 Tax=Citrobacter TaxID=544 RepID=UPI0007943FFF|nr:MULTISPECIES: hypothetical protein [Citrobacter]MBN4856793.1 hypothetical protein [Citrobacter freundii]RXM26241.1 hypothetical protein EO238_00715 [Citrobacter sp. AAK_AS5]SAD84790.1 Uncharacterised protein [Enterobacter cloacae]KAA0568991.1 hypothetical protein F0326_02725 [Citrobacter portucalensis]MCH2696492.1 hypothetical protein [Citrobacter portucalensis]
MKAEKNIDKEDNSHSAKFNFKKYLDKSGVFDVVRYISDNPVEDDPNEIYFNDQIDYIQKQLDIITDAGGGDSIQYNETFSQFVILQENLEKYRSNITKKQTKASLEPLKGSINSLKEKIEAEGKLSNLLTMIAAIVKIVAAAIAVAAV